MKNEHTEVKNYKYHSTAQFRNVVKNIKTQAQFKGVDEEGGAIMDRLAIAPTLMYRGSVKLHGTNASIVLHEDGTISFHSKEKLLGYVTSDGEFTQRSDNAEFCATMQRREVGVRISVALAKMVCKAKYGEVVYPIKLSGEWAGKGIQGGVGISNLNTKAFFLFGIKVGDEPGEWLPADLFYKVEDPNYRIYNIFNFTEYRIEIDFANPEFSQNKLVDLTNEIENECPVTKVLMQNGLIPEGGSLLGEGLVWTPMDVEYCKDSGNWFKTKGKKHSVSNVKSVAAIDPEKLSSIKEFISYAATTNRLEQGLSEVGLDQKLIGKFIGWVNGDINKEEGDVLEASNLTMKDVGKYLATEARVYYIGKLNEEIL